jgi:hypothetical protein
MERIFRYFQLALPAEKGMLLALAGLFFLIPCSYGEVGISLSISATNNAPNNCNARTVSVSVAGGSGSYAYFWSSQPSSSVNLGSGPSITVSPAVATTYTVAVRDKVSNAYAEKSILVSPVLSGSFSLFIPNAFLEGNLWRVLDANQGTGPLNAYQYDLKIIDDWGSTVFSSSATIVSGSTGLMGGDIIWNGRLNGTGSYVPAGNYYYDFRLINCSTNQLFRGTITFFRPGSLSLEVYPNPAQNYVELSLSGLNQQQLNRRTAAALLSAEVQLFSSKGDVLLSEALSALPAQIDLRKLPEDTYSLRFLLNGHVLSERLRIQR